MERVDKVSRWLTGEGRFVAGNNELLEQFCALVVKVGVPLARSWFHIRALRPEYAGVSRIWRRGEKTEERFLGHGFEQTAAYLNSPVRFVVERRELANWRLDAGKALPFPVLEELRAAGYVHYVIAPIIFSDGTANAISWATDHPDGFGGADLQFFAEILPSFSLLVEVKSLRRFATSVLSTYVGREPGQLILRGQVRRGDVRTIRAALMLTDLRDFTALSDALAPSAVIENLNQYFDCVIPPISRRGGEVMEIMGDGILAIFNENGARTPREACQSAYDAAIEGLDALEKANHRRLAGSPHLNAGFALHHGQVSYGNIGSGDRLDFTVIGPDVNLTSRIESLNRELERQMIMSKDFVDCLERPMFEIGHFRLRGFSRMQLLFGPPPVI
jgi:adenylate cyclase